MFERVKRFLPFSRTLPRRFQGVGEDQELIEQMIIFLRQQVSIPRKAAGIYKASEDFLRYSFANQVDELPTIYLLLEQYITQIDPYRYLDKYTLREQIKIRFRPLMKKYPRFGLIFEPVPRQAQLLSRFYVEAVVVEFRKILGATEGDMLSGIHKSLTYFPDLPLEVQQILPIEGAAVPTGGRMDFLKQILNYVLEKVSHKLGDTPVKRVLEHNYRRFAHEYQGLEVFPAIVNLLPHRFLDEEKVALLSKDQMQQVVIDKLKHLEDVNAELLDIQQKLVKTNAELMRSNEDLQQFAYIVSHDLQQPLTSITGFLQLLEKKYGSTIDSSGQTYINYALKSSLRMKDLIMGLLAYSRAGSLKEAFERFSVQELIREIEQSLRISMVQKGVTLVVESLPEINASRLQIFQLFQNLIDNAIKFSDKGAIVEIGFKELVDYWEFYVKDNGIGIPMEQQEMIFGVFQRLHQGYPGTGIGLSICKKIVERHGGHIRVASQEGKGTTFFICLPKHPANSSQHPEKQIGRK